MEELDPSADPEAFKTMQVRTHERTSWFPGKHTKFPFVRVFPWETHEIPREIPWEFRPRFAAFFTALSRRMQDDECAGAAGRDWEEHRAADLCGVELGACGVHRRLRHTLRVVRVTVTATGGALNVASASAATTRLTRVLAVRRVSGTRVASSTRCSQKPAGQPRPDEAGLGKQHEKRVNKICPSDQSKLHAIFACPA